MAKRFEKARYYTENRGGLYLYYESTKEIFLEVLKAESEDTDNMFEEALAEDTTSADILALFLKEQKKEILNQKGLAVAVYEFYFGQKLPKKDNFLRNQFNAAVMVIEKLIDDATQQGEFICDDPRGAARNIMYVLEGLKISAQTIGVTEAMINQEILYIMKGLVADNE